MTNPARTIELRTKTATLDICDGADSLFFQEQFDTYTNSSSTVIGHFATGNKW